MNDQKPPGGSPPAPGDSAPLPVVPADPSAPLGTTPGGSTPGGLPQGAEAEPPAAPPPEPTRVLTVDKRERKAQKRRIAQAVLVVARPGIPPAELSLNRP